MVVFNAFLNRSNKQHCKIARFAAAGIFVLLTMVSYEFVIGLPRRIDGQWVQRRTIWHELGMGCPIPYQRGRIYTFYENDQGQEIRHGQCRHLHSNGAVSYHATYHHGEINGVVSEWNHKSLKTNETIYADGKQLGWSVYVDGKLHYHNEQLLENGRSVASKRFENGRWFLNFHSGKPPIWQIDSSTGELFRLN